MSNRELMKAVAKDMQSKSATLAGLRLRLQRERNVNKPRLP